MAGATHRSRYRVLGPLEIGEGEPIELTRRSHRRLFEILAMETGGRLSTDVLMDRFWAGSPPATAKAALHTHVSALRKILGPDAIVTEDDTYRLNADPAMFDITEFRQRAREATGARRQGEWGPALEAAQAALACWRGQPFAELAYDDFSRPTVVGLEELRLELAELVAEALLALGRPEEVLVDLESLVIEHPLRERLWEHLMTARFRLGRHAEALRAYREVENHLADIGLEPGSRLRRLEERILLEDEELEGSPHNLPAELDEFVGRQTEADAAVALLDTSRLVTIVGSGGAGKTRLATHVARTVQVGYPEGVWLVELATTRDPTLVPENVAVAMGLQPRGDEVMGVLKSATAAARTLIVLDNCEHVLEGAARTVETLLAASPELRVLATSREPLRLRGEAVFELGGLSLPDPNESTAMSAMASEAVELFASRAGHTDRTFVLSDDETPDVVRICRELDGMPLAIELAAARTRSLSVNAIARRLSNHLKLLTGGRVTGPPRQRTLEAAIEWSYRLLDPTQRATLDRLSVFRGGFDLDAAEDVMPGAGIAADDIAAVIADLVDKSLITTYESPVGRRFRLLETVRQFAEQRFRETTHATTVYGRHREWCLGLVQGLWTRALGGGRDELAEVLAADVDNLEGALEWSEAAHDASAVTTLAQALAWHWYLIGHLARSASTLRRTLTGDIDHRDAARGRALLARGLAYGEDLASAMREAREAFDHIDETLTPLEETWVIESLHLVHLMDVTADPGAMPALAARARTAAAGSGDRFAETRALQLTADASCWNGNTEDGLENQRRAIDLARTTGDRTTINHTYGSSIYNYMLDPVERRTAPSITTEEWLALGTLDDQAWKSTATDWLPWVHMQTGDLTTAGDAISRMGDRTLEGYNRSIHLMARATLRWMGGDLDRAHDDVTQMAQRGVSPRWVHTFYPQAAEIAADRGFVDEVLALAEAYLTVEVHPAREAAKLGVLYPLVRAAVDGALHSGSGDGAMIAADTLEKMREILETHPPAAKAWTSLLTHTQCLAFAEAELTRLSGGNPQVWSAAADHADYLYYRLYALWRLGEAHLLHDAPGEAVAALSSALEQSEAAGMHLMHRRVAEAAAELDLG